ncbi:hypothetical protein BCR32DRAFT_330081 [Anaeromyces robustus]|jgi:hypothetical protein|uniref:Mid2 domain-containing protein n=1 Tax=Anaeromyces robustus TaxID=1754192 RepID=A0A1Y1WEN3_9FUNG|nr:hypothetical protein BCR32DRAFT_330081 [Anaeromyces robustus]|eukprot:ORX71706.1 hypothetical protein BCR32DRAFT_330081 [Anaeromyces robustus]
MRLSKVLLLLSAVVTFTYANGLELSEPEDGANGENFDAGFAENSEPEVDHNIAPVESPISNPPAAVSEPIDSIPNPTEETTLPPKQPPVDTSSSIPAGLPPKNPPSVPSTPAAADVAPANQEAADTIPSPSDTAGLSNGNVEADSAEKSEPEDAAAGENVAAGDDNGEGSDDYGDSKPVDQLDGIAPADTLDGANVSDGEQGADGINAADANDEGEQSSPDGVEGAEAEKTADGNDEGLSPTSIAAGLCGAAAVSSAGIFFWVKKSKRQGYVQSVRTQISMV